jgi:hypothetical protein
VRGVHALAKHSTTDDNGLKFQKKSAPHRIVDCKGSTMLGVYGVGTFRAVARRGLPSSQCIDTSQSRFASKIGKNKKTKAVKVDSARSKDLELVLTSLDAPSREEPPISEEEKARRHEIGRNYGIGKFRRHNKIEHDLTCKMQMKKHAMKMLPRDSKLKEEAQKIDAEDPPMWRHLAMWTAPIKDFDASQFIGHDD